MNETYMKATNALLQLGVPVHIKGFAYLREAIMLAVEDRSYIYAMTKRLYPEVATICKTTSPRVERAIRHAIEVAMRRGDADVTHRYFGNTIDPCKGKPTNGEFIALISEGIYNGIL